jgi:hypothetical protein
VPVWSGASARKVRLNRGGNRKMNYALHMIAVTQVRGVGPGSAYVATQKARGKDSMAALRLPRRRISDVVFTALRADQRRIVYFLTEVKNAAVFELWSVVDTAMPHIT